LVVDHYQNIGETSESDNVTALPIDIALPNLTVSHLSFSSTIASGNTATVNWTVQNAGEVPAGADWSDTFYLSRDSLWDSNDRILVNHSVGSSTPVAAGGSYSLSRDL